MRLLKMSAVRTCIVLIIICFLVSEVWCLSQPGAEAIVVGGPTVTEGNSIMLSCAVYNVSGENAKSFRMEWRREGVVLTRGKRVLSPDTRYRVTMIDGVSDRRDFVLHIDRVNRSDAGRYVCWVIVRDWFPNLPDERATSDVDLTVQYFPPHPVCRHSAPTTIFQPGAEVELICSVREGVPTVRTRWKGKNEMVIFADEAHHDGYVTNVLSFLATPEHNGMTFTCKVTSDAFIGVSSTCRVGPIQVVDKNNLQAAEVDSSVDFVESSVLINDDTFSELAPQPPPRKTTNKPSTHQTDVMNVTDTIQKIDKSEHGYPIKVNTLAKKLTVLLSIVIILLVISASLNVILSAKLRQRRQLKEAYCEDDDNNIVPSVISGVSNEEYMDMTAGQDICLDAQFYSTISGGSSSSDEVDYDHPRSLVAEGLPVSSHIRNSSNYRNSIYQNLAGRPITPPRSKRKSVLMMEEHVV